MSELEKPPADTPQPDPKRPNDEPTGDAETKHDGTVPGGASLDLPLSSPD